MNSLELTQPSRQSIVGVVVIFTQNLRKAVNVFISLFAVQYGFKIDPSSGFMIIGIILTLLAFIIISFLQYKRFFFYVDDDNFIIEKGLFSKDKITIPFDRIQSVHIDQHLIQQLLRVVALKIDTAGSAVKEMEIPALKKAYARQLQEYLLERKKAVTTEATEADNQEEAVIDQSDGEPLIRLGLKDVLKVGLTENHLRTGFLLFVVINGYVWQYEEYLLKPFKPYLEKYEDVFLAEWIILLPIIILLFLVVSVLLSLIQSLLRYYKLRFYLNKNGALLISGLLKRAEYQIPINKIQYIKWSGNPLRKLIGLKTLVVRQAGSSEGNDRQSLTVPGAGMPQINAVLDEFFPEKESSRFLEIGSDPFLIRRFMVLYGFLPALLLSLSAFISLYFLVFPMMWLLLSWYFCSKYVATIKLQCNADMLYLTKGWLFPNTVAFKFYKLQSVAFSQSVFLEKRNLANIDFYTAAGSLRMWQIPTDVARGLYNYCMYKIESSKEGWM